jgi:fluoride exporter
METVTRLGLVALGGAAGSMLRYWASVQFGAQAWTTFGVNISGAFLIGVFASSGMAGDLRARLLLASGFLGGYTTFSTWQLEALLSARHGDWAALLGNLAGSVVAGFIAVAAGYWCGSRL